VGPRALAKFGDQLLTLLSPITPAYSPSLEMEKVAPSG
jgi:hypothetical protein